jgi:hypothetical protein
LRSAIKVPWKEPKTEGPTLSQERHAEHVLLRLHTLIKAGYRAKLGVEASGAAQIDLIHSRAQALTLWPDGTVLDRFPTQIEDDNERTIIHCDDHTTFEKFIQSVPSPTLLDKISRTSLADALWLCVAIILGIVLLSLLSLMQGQL